METIKEYIMKRENRDWKDKLREVIIQRIDAGKRTYRYQIIEYNKDYSYKLIPKNWPRIVNICEYDSVYDYKPHAYWKGGYEFFRYDMHPEGFYITNPKIFEVIKFVEEQGLQWKVDIGIKYYIKGKLPGAFNNDFSITNTSGSFIIYW